MNGILPDVSQWWRAAEIYLRVAYASAPIPVGIAGKLEKLRGLPPTQLFDSALVERDMSAGGWVNRYALRLGNCFYPHMKLMLARRPDDRGWLFAADTHDRHCCPAPMSREFDAYCALMQRNAALAKEIEEAWVEAGLPTFKSYLQEDLARRRSGGR